MLADGKPPGPQPARSRVTWVGHATALIELGGTRILTDPVLRDRVGHLRRRGPRPTAAARDGLAAVVISHLHHDHLDLPSLRTLGPGTRIVAPRGAGRVLRRAGFGAVEEVAAGDSVRIGETLIAARPAEHDGRRGPWGDSAPALGYVVEGAGRRVYFAGDTDLFPEMAALASPRVDLALLPVWGWGPTLGAGHMDPRRAADAAALIRPRAAVPIHWGTLYPAALHRFRARALTDPPHAFAGAVARVAPGVRVEILPPGGALGLA